MATFKQRNETRQRDFFYYFMSSHVAKKGVQREKKKKETAKIGSAQVSEWNIRLSLTMLWSHLPGFKMAKIQYQKYEGWNNHALIVRSFFTSIIFFLKSLVSMYLCFESGAKMSRTSSICDPLCAQNSIRL